jgi:hypothetical protein
LWVEKTEDGVAVSGDVFDRNGAIVRLEKNEFTRNEANSFRVRRPNRHEITVYDRFDNPIFTVEYMNPDVIYLTGTFWYPGQRDNKKPLLEIADQSFRCGGITIEQQCDINPGAICIFQCLRLVYG